MERISPRKHSGSYSLRCLRIRSPIHIGPYSSDAFRYAHGHASLSACSLLVPFKMKSFYTIITILSIFYLIYLPIWGIIYT